jgi:hypothetical protein
MTDPLPMPTQREATAHERRARIIAQLHEQAIVTANDLPGRHKAIGAEIAKAARRRKAEAWAVCRRYRSFGSRLRLRGWLDRRPGSLKAL